VATLMFLLQVFILTSRHRTMRLRPCNWTGPLDARMLDAILIITLMHLWWVTGHILTAATTLVITAPITVVITAASMVIMVITAITVIAAITVTVATTAVITAVIMEAIMAVITPGVVRCPNDQHSLYVARGPPFNGRRFELVLT